MKKNTSGFTIVELLVVIVIIAILATISGVVYTGVQDRAKVTKKLAEISTVEQKIAIFDVYNDISTITIPDEAGTTHDNSLVEPLELGSIQNSLVLTGDPYEINQCRRSPMTKDKYCFYTYKSHADSGFWQIIWWNDVEKVWKATRHSYPSGDTTTFDWSGDILPTSDDFPPGQS